MDGRTTYINEGDQGDGVAYVACRTSEYGFHELIDYLKCMKPTLGCGILENLPCDCLL